MSVPTGRADVVNVAVVTAFAPEPVVVSVPVPSVVVPLMKVTVPAGGADAPATVGMVNVSTTGEPKTELAGFAVKVSAEPAAIPTVSVINEEIAPKLPAAGAVAVMVSVPTGRAEVLMVATHEVGVPFAGMDEKLVMPRVTPPLAKVTVAEGHMPLTGAIVSDSVTVVP